MINSGCTVEKNTGLVYDPRFSVSGLNSNVYQVQSYSHVLDILEGSKDYRDYVDSNSKYDDYIRSWNRPTLNWNLECEYEGFSREDALELVTGTIDKNMKVF